MSLQEIPVRAQGMSQGVIINNTYQVAHNNRNVIWHSSGGQKSTIKALAAPAPSGGPGGLSAPPAAP